MLTGCASAPPPCPAIEPYYRYDFTAARERLRASAEAQVEEQMLLNDLRVGTAALADGDTSEAEHALGRAFDLLSTAGLNANRTTAAILLHEGVRIWKGEPFEQALTYRYVATLYAVKGDWENARAASANALFRLTDFGADQMAGGRGPHVALGLGALGDEYTAVDTDFALGFIMQAVSSALSGAGGSDAQFDAALAIRPDLAPVIETLRRRDFDTLLIVDYGKGPTKVAYGPDGTLASFVPQDPPAGPLVLRVGDGDPIPFGEVCSLEAMARDHRWNNLENIRRAKSAIGDGLVLGGAVVAGSGHEGHGRRHDGRYRDRRGGGRHHRNHGQGDDWNRALIGGGMVLAGVLLKSGALADTRHLEFAPASVYLAPLRLGTPRDVRVQVRDDPGSACSLPMCRPGTVSSPRAIYLRLHGPDSPRPPWLRATQARYGNDHTGVRPGDFPWILGGCDVSTPTPAVLAAYRAGGHLLDTSLAELRAIYQAEGIVVAASAEDRRRGASRRHVLEGGLGLFTPEPDSAGYKRIMFGHHPPYAPRSRLARNAASELRRAAGRRAPASAPAPEAGAVASLEKEIRR